MEIGILTQGYVRSESTVQQRIRDIIEEARFADELGLGAYGVPEQHFKFPVNTTAPITAIMAAIAQCTTRIKIIPGVVILPFHHPLNVAENWAAIDIISNGRLYFGFGKGNTPLTSDVYRVAMKDTDPLCDEVLEIIIRSWTQEEFSYNGKFFQLPEINVTPKCITRPHPPIGSAGASISSAKYAGDRKVGIMTGLFTDGWDVLAEWMEIYDTAWAKGTPVAGATPDKTKALLLTGWVGDSYEEIRDKVGDGTMAYLNRHVTYKKIRSEKAGAPIPNYGKGYLDDFRQFYDVGPNAFGTPDMVIEKLLRAKKMGFDRVDFMVDYASHKDTLRLIERLATEIAPALK